MKLKQYLGLAVFSAIALTGCTSTTQINNEAASSYAQVVTKVRAEGKIDTTSQTAKRIYKVFNKLLPYARQANHTGVPFSWQMTVAKSNELNAWAMPGGKMMVYTGLVERLKLSDPEIATVIGHEMAHALKEHSKSSQGFSIAIGVVTELGKAALSTQG